MKNTLVSGKDLVRYSSRTHCCPKHINTTLLTALEHQLIQNNYKRSQEPHNVMTQNYNSVINN